MHSKCTVYMCMYVYNMYTMSCIIQCTCTCIQGPMSVVVQEFDGRFSHNIQVEDSVTVHELPCHSKIRKWDHMTIMWKSCDLCYWAERKSGRFPLLTVKKLRLTYQVWSKLHQERVHAHVVHVPSSAELTCSWSHIYNVHVLSLLSIWPVYIVRSTCKLVSNFVSSKLLQLCTLVFSLSLSLSLSPVQHGGPCIMGSSWSRVPMDKTAHLRAIGHNLALLAQVRAWCQRPARCRGGLRGFSDQPNSRCIPRHHTEFQLLL